MFLCPEYIQILIWNIVLYFTTDVTLKMSVKLNVGFQEDLKNSSSALYRSYKTDLEAAVNFDSRIFFGTGSLVYICGSQGLFLILDSRISPDRAQYIIWGYW